ncbi:MAG: hypothetical protein V4671_23710 [Armatimonadota bacterium]
MKRVKLILLTFFLALIAAPAVSAAVPHSALPASLPTLYSLSQSLPGDDISQSVTDAPRTAVAEAVLVKTKSVSRGTPTKPSATDPNGNGDNPSSSASIFCRQPSILAAVTAAYQHLPVLPRVHPGCRPTAPRAPPLLTL